MSLCRAALDCMMSSEMPNYKYLLWIFLISIFVWQIGPVSVLLLDITGRRSQSGVDTPAMMNNVKIRSQRGLSFPICGGEEIDL